MVGAVLVHNGKVIGEGYHQQYGGPHAEINCLASVSAENRSLIPESTMYVSLEPCAHYGKTPPCAKRIVDERIRKVIVCNNDPFDAVNGKGFDILKAENIETSSEILAEQGRWVNRRFFCFHEQLRPYIILKWAQTSNGFFAPADHSRFQISNQHSQQLVHKWRTEEAAILVGTTTALNDNPYLTARLWKGEQPLRLVLDRTLRLSSDLNIFNDDAETWIVNETKNAKAAHITYVQLDFTKDVLQQLLSKLYEAKVLSLIVEGGAALLNSFIQKRLWDEARVFTGDSMLIDGIAAPLLTNADKAFSTTPRSDQLNVYVNKKSAYRYVQQMEL